MSGKHPSDSLGALLAGWGKASDKTPEEIGKAFEMLDVCGGAYLFLTREEAGKIAASGTKFEARIDETIPADGRGSIRVRCGRPLMVKTLSEEIPDSEQLRTRTVKYGLCDRCSGWELAIRTRLREAAKEAEAKAKTGTRKRGFREEADE